MRRPAPPPARLASMRRSSNCIAASTIGAPLQSYYCAPTVCVSTNTTLGCINSPEYPSSDASIQVGQPLRYSSLLSDPWQHSPLIYTSVVISVRPDYFRVPRNATMPSASASERPTLSIAVSGLKETGSRIQRFALSGVFCQHAGDQRPL